MEVESLRPNRAFENWQSLLSPASHLLCHYLGNDPAPSHDGGMNGGI